ncbi:hypothetical protein BCR43DRAFT_492729 [Syncephalastrum racemosum]|uniref:GAR domain-containing protein n=1 Tax=Syncephalastrum racemosum TaxID=13706 RepID=A0A1X2H9D5_SYNRA|nr:hypothetical protein BCR43DRAFT_492729 [Syncephalastrum racemosum]
MTALTLQQHRYQTSANSPNTMSRPLPPMSIQQPTSSLPIEDSVLDRLNAAILPDKEINDILNLHDAMTSAEVDEGFRQIMCKMNYWMEAAQVAVYTLEVQIKEDGQNTQETLHLLELAVGRMEPLMTILGEIEDIMEDKFMYDDSSSVQQKKRMTKMAITKIQSEWSGLQHFLSSVKQQLAKIRQQKELVTLMDCVLQQIDDLSTLMFQFQEKRHQAALQQQQQHPPPPPPTTTAMTTAGIAGLEDIGSPVSSTTSSSCLFSPSTTTTTATSATTLSLTEPAQAPKDDQILAEIDSKVEPLFSDVQRIYNTMMGSAKPADPTGMLARKHQMVQDRWELLRIEIDELKEELREDRWLTVFRQVADQVDVMIDGLDKTVTQCYAIIQQVVDTNGQPAVKSILRRPSPTQPPHRQSSPTTGVDREKFRSIEKTFETQYKFYTPSVGKMLAMLGERMVTRGARDNAVTRRHDAMVQRWVELKAVMDDLHGRDLPEASRLLLAGSRCTTPQTQKRAGSSLAYARSYEPLRPSTSDSSSLHNNNSITTTTQPPRRTKTPRAEHNDDIASWMQPTKSTLLRTRRAQSVDAGQAKEKARSKTPTTPHRKKSLTPVAATLPPPRPKSSMHHYEPKRTMTPSLIPRPKTPTSHGSQSFIPRRPGSSMALSRTNTTIFGDAPPVPPVPSLRQTSVSTLRKKQSMPTLHPHHQQQQQQQIQQMEARRRCMTPAPNQRRTHVPQSRSSIIAFDGQQVYLPDPRDPLDVQVAKIINDSPIAIKCQRGPAGNGSANNSTGRYYFGNELHPSAGSGKKLYTCRLMTYAGERGTRKAGEKRNKVLVRVGGGWQDLEMFLLDHASLLMACTSSPQDNYMSL